MTARITAHTRLVGLLGWPVRHSLSPVLHNAAFRELDLDLVYLALPTPPDRLEAVVGSLGAMEVPGANVTVPHKESVTDLCDRLTDEARVVGAVNTLLWDADGLVGDNTDALGLGHVLSDDLGIDGRITAVVLGTGGAARACAVALGRVGAGVTFVGRRPDAARRLAGVAADQGATGTAGVDLDDTGAVSPAVSRADLVVNATPLGLEHEDLPAPFMSLHEGQIAYDLVYRPPETPFLVAAKRSGAEAHHGLGMLVAQAAESFRRWTGHDAPIATMSAAGLAALVGGDRARDRAGDPAGDRARD